MNYIRNENEDYKSFISSLSWYNLRENSTVFEWSSELPSLCLWIFLVHFFSACAMEPRNAFHILLAFYHKFAIFKSNHA